MSESQIPGAAPGAAAGPAAPADSSAPAAPRRRTALWIGGCCGLVLLLLALSGIGGGIAILISRRAEPTPPAPALSTAKQETFSFTYPAAWDGLAQPTVDPDVDQVIGLASPNGPETIVVYRYSSSQHAVSECRMQAPWIGFDLDGAPEPEELEATKLDGRDAAHHQVRGKAEGKDVLAEVWCADDGPQVVVLVGRSVGTTERAPEVQTVLDSWRWTPGG